MDDDTGRSEERSRIMLSGELTVGTAGQLKRSLVETLAAGKDVQVEFDEVTEVDLSALQLLCAAGRTARNSGRKLTIEGIIPGMVIDLIKSAGFDNHSSYSDHECIWSNPDEWEAS